LWNERGERLTGIPAPAIKKRLCFLRETEAEIFGATVAANLKNQLHLVCMAFARE
jgi:hypothetical protein